MIPSYSLAQVFGISISEQRKIYFNHRNTLISLLSNTLIGQVRANFAMTMMAACYNLKRLAYFQSACIVAF
ncbi:hypothetical protein CBG25_08275 [Arsenophonus sp. ENCA]|uniref:hypothetical protein n=1 Tax=Arsenophonus sp. ENCA TaxID=1987579 RepID=UPI000BCEDB8D|nr:hypothetical protein [Arsenophonus sp. ENCA]PAV02890.1 hypothetical protein CBG25_08275 [Arsenophonus sp. ENCA]